MVVSSQCACEQVVACPHLCIHFQPGAFSWFSSNLSHEDLIQQRRGEKQEATCPQNRRLEDEKPSAGSKNFLQLLDKNFPVFELDDVWTFWVGIDQLTYLCARFA